MWHFVVLNRRMNEFLSFDLLQIGLNPKMVFNLFLFLQHIQAINFDVDTVWGTYNKFTSTDIPMLRVIETDMSRHVLHRFWSRSNTKT